MADKPLQPLLQYGARLGLTRSQSYAAAREGTIPTILVGKLLFVPVVLADRKLGLTDNVVELPRTIRQVA
jgi:hypothetical protein